jgi:hypothetical protein
MSDENKPKRGRPPLPPHLHKQHAKILAVVSPEFSAKIRAEADRRGCSYSQLIVPFIERGMAELSETQAA